MNSKDIQRLVRPNILAMKAYSSARDEYNDLSKDMIFLDANESPFQSEVNRYPDPQQMALKERLVEIKGVKKEQILLGNGSDEVLDLLVRVFCEPAIDSIITLPPTYGMYAVIANSNNVTNLEVLLTSDFEPNVDRILRTVTVNTKMLLLCSPNNPTGTSFSEMEVIKLVEAFNGLVVIDEAYIDFSKKDSWLKRLNDFPNLVITQTLSKAYGMAGIRLGICYASSEIIAILNRIKPPYNVNELTQEYAISALNKLGSISKTISCIIDNKDALYKALLKVSFIDKVFQSDANFFLIKVDDAALRYEQLIRNGIVVRNRSTQPLCENTLRISVGTEEENNQLITVLNSI